jgi:cyclopropane-fatty-acyl-phospholipid synthase
MKRESVHEGDRTAAFPRHPIDAAFRGALRRTLAGIRDARLIVVDADGVETFGPAHLAGLRATVTVHDPSFYRATVTRGVVGAAEAYMDGAWDSDDLVSLIRIMARNRAVADRLDGPFSRVAAASLRWYARLRRNTRTGSRRNIEAHYDLGNDFFASFLDETMTYSSAVWEDDAGASLAEASAAKNERVCRKLELKPSDHVLEIGSGWGGFAIHAASRFGCRVTTTTLSREQLQLARERVAAAGLSDRVEVIALDYRDLTGTYDKLVSIEMIEAVGHEFMDEYFRRCCERLKPEGSFLLEAITIPDQDYEASKRSVEFIKRYIFPGGSLPSVSSMCDSVKRVTDFRVLHLEEISPHYARTLAEWRRRFRGSLDDLRARYPRRFLRMWEFYLCYCEGGFRERAIGTVQMLLERPLGRREPVLGPIGGTAPRAVSATSPPLPGVTR